MIRSVPASAAGSIAQAGLSGGDTAIAVGVFVVIASLTVAGPVAFYLVAAERAAGTLGTIKEFLSRNNAVIMMVLLLVLGAKLLGQGLGAVAS